MCSDNKLPCLNRCCQLLHPASVVNFIWFTDDKLSKFCCCSPKKCPKRSRSRACGDSLTSTRSSKTMHQHAELVRWSSYWLSRHLTSYVLRVAVGCNGVQCTCLSEYTRRSSPMSRAASQHLMAPVETSKIVVITHFTTLPLRHN